MNLGMKEYQVFGEGMSVQNIDGYIWKCPYMHGKDLLLSLPNPNELSQLLSKPLPWPHFKVPMQSSSVSQSPYPASQGLELVQQDIPPLPSKQGSDVEILKADGLSPALHML